MFEWSQARSAELVDRSRVAFSIYFSSSNKGAPPVSPELIQSFFKRYETE